MRWIGTLAALLYATSAHAATSVKLVSVGGDFAMPGSEIILQTVVTANGGETTWFVQGQLFYNATWLDPSPTPNTQVNLSTVGVASPGWLSGGLACVNNVCTAFNQLHRDLTNGNPTQAEGGLTDFPLAVTRFVVDPATPLGTVLRFDWRTTPSTLRLDWFGLTSAPGVELTSLPGLSIMVIPEPSTVALLAVGLLSIALAARRT